MNAPPKQPTWSMYRALVGIGMLCGLLIALVFDGTRPIIEKNRAEFLEKAIFNVLGEAESRRSFALQADGSIVPAVEGDADLLHAGFDAAGRLVGVAIEASGMGYADTITVLYGYAPETKAIVGIQVLASKETPGLGDKIEKDHAFLANFEALDASLEHRIETVKHGAKTDAWQIDGITGATISSVAIGDMLAASSERWVPIIDANLEQLTAGGADGE